MGLTQWENLTEAGKGEAVQEGARTSEFPLQTYLSALSSSCPSPAKGPLRVEAGRRGEERRGQGLGSPQQRANPEEALAQTKEGEAVDGGLGCAALAKVPGFRICRHTSYSFGCSV